MHGIQDNSHLNSYVRTQHCCVIEDNVVRTDSFFGEITCSSPTFHNIQICMPVVAPSPPTTSVNESGRRPSALRDPTVLGPKVVPRKRHVVKLVGPFPKVNRAPGATIRMPPRRDERWERSNMGPERRHPLLETARAINTAIMLRKQVLTDRWNGFTGRNELRARQFKEIKHVVVWVTKQDIPEWNEDCVCVFGRKLNGDYENGAKKRPFDTCRENLLTTCTCRPIRFVMMPSLRSTAPAVPMKNLSSNQADTHQCLHRQ